MLIPLAMKNPIISMENITGKLGKARYRYPLSKYTKDIQRAGFKIEKTYRVFEYPYHRSLY